MSNDTTVLRGDGSGDASAFDCSRWDVYRVAVEFQGLVPLVLRRRGSFGLRDQLERASASIVLNIAEGCGRTAAADKARFYSIARGSAMECGAVLDIALSRGSIDDPLHRRGLGLLIRVGQMLTKLVLRMQRPWPHAEI